LRKVTIGAAVAIPTPRSASGLKFALSNTPSPGKVPGSLAAAVAGA